MRTSDPPVADVPAESPRVTSATAAADPRGEDGGEQRDDHDASPRGRLRPYEAERGSRLLHEAPQLGCRSAGSFAMARASTSSTAGGSALPALAGARRLLLEVAYTSATSEAPVNGSVPVSVSKSRQPSA